MPNSSSVHAAVSFHDGRSSWHKMDAFHPSCQLMLDCDILEQPFHGNVAEIGFSNETRRRDAAAEAGGGLE